MEQKAGLQNHCSEFGCEVEIHYLNINSGDGLVMGGFCKKHGDEIEANPIPGFHLEEIPDPRSDRPVPSPRKENPHMSAVPPTPSTTMAPPDAVFDGEESAREHLSVSTEEASSNFFWKYGKNETFRIQTTIRGVLTPEQTEAHIQSVIAAMGIVLNRGGHSEFTQVPQQPSAVPATPAAPTPPSPPAPPAGPTTSPNGGTPPAAASTETEGVFVAVKMTTAPRADGKAEIAFFAQGDKFARIKMIGDPERCAQDLSKTAAWTPQHLLTPATYANIKYKISWRNSEKVNNQGKPYRNVVDVSPA